MKEVLRKNKNKKKEGGGGRREEKEYQDCARMTIFLYIFFFQASL